MGLNSIFLCLLLLGNQGFAKTDNHLHILIPGGVGGGWDNTGRALAQSLRSSQFVDQVSVENMSGGGGGRALAHMIETKDRQKRTLMVHSTPIIIRSLKKVFPQSHRDVTPIAALIADSGVIAVASSSKIHSFSDLVTRFQDKPRELAIAGGSVRGGLDHLIAALAFQSAGWKVKDIKYVPYDAGGKALTGLLSGEVSVLVSGFGEVIDMEKAGMVRILAVTSAKRQITAPQIPTLTELGYPVTFVNWRGVFAAPGLSKFETEELITPIRAVVKSQFWQEVRTKRGWGDLYLEGDAFKALLVEQESSLRQVMTELGFIQGGSRP